MSKAFKIFVDVIIAICIVAVLALVVPPLVGFSTQIAGPEMDSNYPEGSVVYGSRKPISSLRTGDEIVYTGETFSYIYEVKDVNSETGEVEVVNNESKEEGFIQLSKTVVKKIVVVPVIGYLLLAMQSNVGKMMIISGALFLVMLFVVAEILDHKRKQAKMATEDAMADQEEDDDRYFAALTKSMEKPSSLEIAYNEAAAEATEAALNKPVEETFRPQVEEEPVEEFILKKAEPVEEEADEFAATKIMPGTAATEFNEATPEEIEDMLQNLREAPVEEAPAKETKAEAPKAEKEKEVKKAEPVKEGKVETAVPEEEYKYIPPAGSKAYNAEEIVEAFADIPDEESAASHDLEESELPDVSAALVAALSTTQVNRTYQQPVKKVEEVVEPEQLDEIELAIPVRSAEEILDEAYGKGYDPEVIQDGVTNVKLIDFSECLIKAE